jgi:hypothetical protein
MEEIDAASEIRAAMDLQCGDASGGEEEGVGVRENEGAAAGILGAALYSEKRGRGPRPDALAINGHGGGQRL